MPESPPEVDGDRRLGRWVTALAGALALFLGGAIAVVTFVLASHSGAGAAFSGAFAIFFLVVGLFALTATITPRDQLMSPRTWRGLAATLALGGLALALVAPWFELIPWFVLALVCLVRAPGAGKWIAKWPF